MVSWPLPRRLAVTVITSSASASAASTALGSSARALALDSTMAKTAAIAHTGLAECGKGRALTGSVSVVGLAVLSRRL